MMLLIIPVAFAETDCGLSNIASCLPQKVLEFVINILNAPLTPIISFVKNMLTAQVDIGVFHSIWSIIVYTISLFYGLFLIFAGFNFMISGYDVTKREKAKEWFKNIILMVFFIQASFLLYSLSIDLAAGLASGTMNLIDPNFFMLTADNIINMGLEVILLLIYVFTLAITAILLILRYIFVCVGVMFLPLGIFFYFTPPLNAYGKLVLNVLAVALLLPFIQIMILLAASKLIALPLFANFKILVMISSFAFIDFIMLLLILFITLKAASAVINSGTAKMAVTVAKTMM